MRDFRSEALLLSCDSQTFSFLFSSFRFKFEFAMAALLTATVLNLLITWQVT